MLHCLRHTQGTISHFPKMLLNPIQISKFCFTCTVHKPDAKPKWSFITYEDEQITNDTEPQTDYFSRETMLEEYIRSYANL